MVLQRQLGDPQVAVDAAFSFYAGVNNLGDEKPDIGFETNAPISPVGRYAYAGVKVRLDPQR